MAEHHGMPAVASSAPAVLIGHLADATTTLRVGAGGVMLPNHAPLVIAEQYATLEALHPGRIDLGLGRAPGTDQVTARALRRVGRHRAGHLPPGRGGADRLPGRQRGPGVPSGPRSRARLPARGLAARIIDLQRPAGRNARTALLLRLPLRPRPLGPGGGAVPEQVPALVPAGPSPTSCPRCRSCARPTEEEARWLAGPSALSTVQLRTGRFGPVPSPEEAAAYRYTDQERALIDSTLATHLIGDPGRCTPDWSPCRPAPAPTRSCSPPGPTPSRRGSSP